MQVRLRYGPQDIHEFLRYHWWQHHRDRLVPLWVASAFTPAFFLLVLDAFLDPRGVAARWWIYGVLILATASAFPLLVRSAIRRQAGRRWRERSERGLDDVVVDLGPQGLDIQGSGAAYHIAWTQVSKRAARAHGIYLYTERLGVIVIPRAAFADARLFDELSQRVATGRFEEGPRFTPQRAPPVPPWPNP